MTTILLADDHQLVRDTIAAYLASSGRFKVETAKDLDEALEILNKPTQVDIAMLDYQMPGMDGLEGFAQVRSRYPDLKLTIISGVAEADVAEKAMGLGAKGYFPKSISVTAMVDGLRRVLEGESVNDFAIFGDATGSAPSLQERFGLTSRENQIVQMIALGHSNKLIASELELAEVTVKFHVSNVMEKLGVTNRTQAAVLARNEAAA